MLEHLYHKPAIDPDELYNELQEYKELIEPYVCDTSLYLHNAIKEGKEILLEGQLGSAERSGSWYLSNGYIFIYIGRIRSNRSRYSTIRDQRDRYSM